MSENSLVEYLRNFNRKERFYLVGFALGKPDFRLSEDFRGLVGEKLGLSIPDDAFVAMDYHLDWLYASLCLHKNGGDRGPHSNRAGLIHAQQEDIDLLVAYQDERDWRLIFIEAKGASAWSNKQLKSKTGRLTKIFDLDGQTFAGVSPHLMLMSPSEPAHLDFSDCPAWMLRDGKIPWIKLTMQKRLVKVTRCSEDGHISAQGDHWRVIDA